MEMMLAQAAGSAGTGLLEIFALAAAITSVILAIVAIFLSLLLYRMSNQVAMGTKETAGSIRTNVDRVEDLFRTFHAETFAAYKADHEKAMDIALSGKGLAEREAEVQAKVEEQGQELIAELQQRIEMAGAQVARTGEAQVEAVKKAAKEALAEAVTRTRETEEQARDEMRASEAELDVLMSLRVRPAILWVPEESIPARLHQERAVIMDPALLSKTLAALLKKGLVEREETGGVRRYRLSAAGRQKLREAT